MPTPNVTALTFSVCARARPQCVCLAVQGAAGAAEMSKNREWLVYQVSESGLSAGPLGACETLICEGDLCVLGV